MSTYDKLDALIVAAIARGRSPLYTTDVQDEAERLRDLTGAREAFRVTDRRLQALRRAGRVEYRTKAKGGPGWFVKGES